ncbi:nucleotidyltransferase domain-containing protein [Orrella sp. JC864]|uniref:nucleotidyltransferase domain-containing protein n=1 Tax=Orrella sp. JC864 TaxID=3120298 RepID=UPI00300BCA34
MGSRIDPTTDSAVREFLAAVKKRPDYAGAVLFGSRARGTHIGSSDADVAILLKGPAQKTIPIALEMADAAYAVLLKTGVNVQAMPIWVDQWEHPDRHSNPWLLKNIKEEGVLL